MKKIYIIESSEGKICFARNKKEINQFIKNQITMLKINGFEIFTKNSNNDRIEINYGGSPDLSLSITYMIKECHPFSKYEPILITSLESPEI